MEIKFHSNGKLLLSGEYAVLDGALALALPTSLGQSLHVTPGDLPGLSWQGLDVSGNTWLTAYFEQDVLSKSPASGPFPTDAVQRLLYTLQVCVQLNPAFLDSCLGKSVCTQLEFPRLWGLGSSSTFIANLGQWANVNPYTLLRLTLGGSGYDVACATQKKPIFYRKDVLDQPIVSEAQFYPEFADLLWLVYLNTKQDSREGINRYRLHRPVSEKFLKQISSLSQEFSCASTLDDFQVLMRMHEQLISGILQLQRVQERLFPDFSGVVKSLGAWGGDFVLAAGPEDTPAYFKNKGYVTVLSLADLMA
jgi:mevalonate kinase